MDTDTPADEAIRDREDAHALLSDTEAGQRRINLIWEMTQAAIALIITAGMLYLAVVGTISETVTNAFFLIVGFYFSRTNHQSIGGIGKKPAQTYIGR